MLRRRWAFALAIVGLMLAMIVGLALTQLPVIGAGGLLHPARTRSFSPTGAFVKHFSLPQNRATFDIDAVSPERAAAAITIPVLLVHGAMDIDTRPEHSQRVFAALNGPKRLILVANAGHNGSSRAEVWEQIERWIDQVIAPAA